jgi:hypothetical protein
LLVPLLALWLAAAPTAAQAQHERYRAPGLTSLTAGAKIVLMPPDVELFSMSAGGVLEPQAQWTQAAHKNLSTALQEHFKKEGRSMAALGDAQLTDEINDLNALYGAVAGAIAVHHLGPSKLPTKQDKLDWTMGTSTQAIAKASGAQYGLFVWMRDSYASAERKAVIVGMALLGVGVSGGFQIGYASLVELETGRVVWFNRLVSGFGDVREIEPARATVSSLLGGIPN